MSRVHHVKAAAKDYPQAGIKKGEPYYWWKNYRQSKQRSKERPKPSQVASSDYARSVLSLVEGLEAWGKDPWTADDRDSLVSELEQIRDEEQDKLDNLPEGLQQGDTGMMLEQRVSDLDEWISELESLEFAEDNDYGEEETPLEQALSSSVSV